MKNGRVLNSRKLSLREDKSHHTDIKFTDFIEKQFIFDSPVFLDGMSLSKKAHYNQEALVENLTEKLDIFNKWKNNWRPLVNTSPKTDSHPGFEAIRFDPIWAEGLKFVNKRADDLNFYIHKIWVNEIFQKSYHLRVRKIDDLLVFWVNNKEVGMLTLDPAASRVGLLIENGAANFNGITLYHLGD